MKTRTIRLDVMVKGRPNITLEMPLPTATRLTDQLVDAEFLERRAHELSFDSHALLERPAPPSCTHPKPVPFFGRLTAALRQAIRFPKPAPIIPPAPSAGLEEGS